MLGQLLKGMVIIESPGRYHAGREQALPGIHCPERSKTKKPEDQNQTRQRKHASDSFTFIQTNVGMIRGRLSSGTKQFRRVFDYATNMA
jgi:hypothetical protein